MFPATSVIVMMVLLNVAWMCATPVWMFFRTFFLTFFALATPMRVQFPIYFFVATFLPATVLRGPLRVRALVWVRWPRTGSPLRWRRPR